MTKSQCTISKVLGTSLLYSRGFGMQRQTDTEKRSSEEAMGQSQYITGETKLTLCLKLLKMYIGRSEHRLQGKDLKVCAV